MMTLEMLKQWIEAYADAKGTGNPILMQYAKQGLEVALSEIESFKAPKPTKPK